MVTEFNNKNNSAQIRKLIEVLATDYATSRDANRRKGALIGLAAMGLGLGKVFVTISHRNRVPISRVRLLLQDSGKYVQGMVTPIMTCLSDPDIRVRYFACESLYNVVKVARSAIIPFFPELFAALSRLVTDSDQLVKDGSELLDRLLKVATLRILFNLKGIKVIGPTLLLGHCHGIVANIQSAGVHSFAEGAHLCKGCVCPSVCDLMDIDPKCRTGYKHGQLFDRDFGRIVRHARGQYA